VEILYVIVAHFGISQALQLPAPDFLEIFDFFFLKLQDSGMERNPNSKLAAEINF